MGCRSPCAPVPARLPFYYGWVIVGLFVVDAVLCSTWSTMLLNMLTMGPLYLEWERAGQSRVLVSTMFGVGTMTAALMAPMAGRAIDRWGGQVMMPAALCIIGVGMLMISLTPTSLPWLLAPTFLLARGGAKCMTSPYRSAVLNQWFFKKRGKATATIILTQQCLTNFVVCPLYGMLLATWGWRKASLLGFVLNVAAAPFFALLLFHTPESVGLLPDGVKQYSRLAEDEDEEESEDEVRPPPPPTHTHTFYTKNDQFTKTGRNNTGKTQKRPVSRRSTAAWTRRRRKRSGRSSRGRATATARTGGRKRRRLVSRVRRRSARYQVRKRLFFSSFYIKMIILPGQARDKHRENSKKEACFPHAASMAADVRWVLRRDYRLGGNGLFPHFLSI
eukprot:COSAG06_NODE_1206_length_10270_cov_8.055255_10_plen_390_part_00